MMHLPLRLVKTNQPQIPPPAAPLSFHPASCQGSVHTGLLSTSARPCSALPHTPYPERSSLLSARPLLATVQLPAATTLPHQAPRHPASLGCLVPCCVSTLYFPCPELTAPQLKNCVTGSLVAVFLLKCKSLKSGDSGCPTPASSEPRAGSCSQVMPRQTLLKSSG